MVDLPDLLLLHLLLQKLQRILLLHARETLAHVLVVAGEDPTHPRLLSRRHRRRLLHRRSRGRLLSLLLPCRLLFALLAERLHEPLVVRIRVRAFPLRSTSRARARTIPCTTARTTRLTITITITTTTITITPCTLLAPAPDVPFENVLHRNRL